MLPSAASNYYDSQRNTTLEFLALAAELWGAHPPRDFDSWFARHVEELVAAAMIGQQQVISGSDAYVASVLEETGVPVAAEVLAQPAALVGVASDGRPLDSLLYGPVITAKGKIADGASPSVAWESGLQSLALRFKTLLADTSRAAAGLSITTRPGVGYVRMLVGRSCSRCAILAGRYYRYNVGFLRHPQCNCKHIPANEDTADDMRTDPKLFFDSLPEAEQARVFTAAGAQAIRDGADINQVVNARRGAHGLDVAGSSLLYRHLARRDVYGQQLNTTTEGVTKRGTAGRAFRARGRNPKSTPRLMPEAIYELAGSREEALQLLRMNGYVLDGPPSMQRATVALKSVQPENRPRVDGSLVPPVEPPIVLRGASGGSEPDRNWNFPESMIPDRYPTMRDGSDVKFAPRARPSNDDQSRRHIWDGEPGEPNKGGHRAGTGRPGKSEYPADWGDDDLDSAIDEVLAFSRSVSESKGTTTFRGAVQRNGKRVAMAVQTKIVDGVPIVWTAFPINGDGVIYNDRKKGPIDRPFNPVVVQPKE